MSNVLILTPDVLKEKLAGPAIRVWEMAKVLSKSHDVHLVSVSKTPVERAHLAFLVSNIHRHRELKKSVRWADVVIVQGIITSQFPFILRESKYLVVDLYDPLHIELLEQSHDLIMSTRIPKVSAVIDTLNVQIDHADLILCASSKQRDFWLGQMAARGRVNPLTYTNDGELTNLLTIAPFGLEATPPKRIRSAIKGVVPGIEQSDEVLIWGGGIYNWFDPLTLIRAMAIVKNNRPNARLFFMGSGHPNPNVPQMSIAGEASRLAEDLGLLNKTVFFNDEWVTYDERAQFLLDAEIGISTHTLNLETEFSFRTRILDYLWANLPIIVSEGDTFAQLVDEKNLGIVVPEKNASALANAIVDLLSDPKKRQTIALRVQKAAQQFEWPLALSNLVQYVDNPHQAPDRRYPRKKSPLWRAFTSAARHGRWGAPIIFLYRIRSLMKRVLKVEQ